MNLDPVSQAKRRWIPVYVLLLIGGFLMLVALLYLYFRTGYDAYLSGSILLVMIEGYVGWSLYKLVSTKPEKRILITLLQCEKCGFETERSYKNGDKLFEKAGTCPKCGGDTLVITAIFLRSHKS